MNTENKSIAYAFIANGVQIYLSDYEYFLASRLCCLDCGDAWYMNLTECFLCGAINPFLYTCSNCKNLIPITNSTKICSNSSCNSENSKLLSSCPNSICISNTEHAIKAIIDRRGGVFNKDSGMLISQQYCLNCGSNQHIYKTYKIIVRDTETKNVSKEDLRILIDYCSDNSKVLIKYKTDDRMIKYQLLGTQNMPNTIVLDKMKDSIGDIVSELFPVRMVNLP